MIRRPLVPRLPTDRDELRDRLERRLGERRVEQLATIGRGVDASRRAGERAAAGGDVAYLERLVRRAVRQGVAADADQDEGAARSGTGDG